MERSQTSSATDLFEAVGKGDVQLAQRLLANQDVNAYSQQQTPLIKAATEGQLEMVELLLRHGAAVNSPYQGKDDEEGFGSRHGATALMLVAAQAAPQSQDILQRLLRARADVNATDSLGRTALMYAAHQGTETTVQLLLTAGAEVNTRDAGGWSALMYASHIAKFAEWARKQKIADLLKAVGAVEDGLLNVQLQLAAQKCDSDSIRSLIAQGANPNCSDHYRSPLFTAVKKNHIDGVHVLLDAGAEPDFIGDVNFRPLLWACSEGNVEIVRALIAAGADVLQKDQRGRTPLDRAKEAMASAHTPDRLWIELIAMLRQAEDDASHRAQGASAAKLHFGAFGDLSPKAQKFINAIAVEAGLGQLRFAELAEFGTILLESELVSVERAEELWRQSFDPTRAQGWSVFITCNSFNEMAPERLLIENDIRAFARKPAPAFFERRKQECQVGTDAQKQWLAKANHTLINLDLAALPKGNQDKPTFNPSEPRNERRLVFLRRWPEIAPILYQFGGWGRSPIPPVQAAVLKHWQERYGARLAYLGNKSLELFVRKPLVELVDIRDAAMETALFSGRISNIEESIVLARSRCWRFAWD